MSAIEKWKEAWRITSYFYRFLAALALLIQPFRLGDFDIIENHPIFTLVFYVCMIIFYLPFAIVWSARFANLKAPSKEEAEQKRILDRKNLDKRIRARNTKSNQKVEPTRKTPVESGNV